MIVTDAKMLRVAVIVLAAGSGSRFGSSTNKVWLNLGDQKIISHSLKNAAKSFSDPRVILVINPVDQSFAKETLASEVSEIKVEVVHGGETRHDSEFNALSYLAKEIEGGEIDVVLIHDGARPLASSALFEEIVTTAYQFGGALPAIAINPSELEMTSSRKVVRVQTPQAFRAREVLKAYRQSQSDNFIGTDTAACMEKYFPEIKNIAVKGEIENIKITFAQDLLIAQRTLESTLASLPQEPLVHLI